MRDALSTLRLMITISWRSDRVRSVAALATATGQMASIPLRAIGMKLLADGVVAHDGAAAARGGLVIVAFSALFRLSSHASFNVRMRLRENTQLFLDTHIMGLTAGIPGLEHHERPEYLDQVELIRNERGHLANPFNPISWSFASILQLTSVLGLLAGVHPILALLPLAGVPSAWVTARTETWHADLRERQAQPNRVLRHLMELTAEAPAAKEIRIYGLGEELVGRRRTLFDRLEQERIALGIRQVVLNTGAWLVFAAAYVGALAWAVHLATADRITVGDVVLVLSVGAQLNQQLAELTENVTWFVATHRAVRRLLWFTRYADGAHEAVAPRTPTPVPARLRDGVRLSGVEFAYPGSERPVLTGVDLFLPAGTTVAVVGENGAGKTTLMKLLCRFYEPAAGAITVDGIDLRDLDLAEWRRRVSAGFQDFARFQLLARETVGIGDTSLPDSDQHVLAALDRAAASDVVHALPDGLDTQLGRDFDGGAELSIGQWQKLALGRAMMRAEPLLLILDEPTASLDAQTESLLFDRFHGAARDVARRTGAITILISHRFSTVRMADLILVIEGGHITEAGPHDELITAGGLYAELYDMQARAYRD